MSAAIDANNLSTQPGEVEAAADWLGMTFLPS